MSLWSLPFIVLELGIFGFKPDSPVPNGQTVYYVNMFYIKLFCLSSESNKLAEVVVHMRY